jgi:hypothetical protein
MWAALIPIIAQYGLPLAEQLFQKWSSGAAPTQADFDALKAATQVTARQQLIAQLTAANIPLTDPHAVALLALVGN